MVRLGSAWHGLAMRDKVRQGINKRLYDIIEKKVKMEKNIQRLKKEIFDAVMNNKEEKDVDAIIERSVKMTLKYVDTQVSTQKFYKDD